MPEPARLSYRSEEWAERTGATPLQVRRWLKSGALRGKKIGGIWHVYADNFEGYDAERAVSQRGQPVPADEGRSVGGERVDAGRTPPVTISTVERRGVGAAPGPHPAKGSGGRGSKAAPGWTVPDDVAQDARPRSKHDPAA